MRGMNRSNGLPLDGTDHIKQSIRDIITTPLGSRVMLHEYGCNLSNLIDSPVNELFAVELHSGIAEALQRWEPRFNLTSVWIEGRTADGKIEFGIEGNVIANGAPIRMEGITL